MIETSDRARVRKESSAAVLIGTAVGDAIGLPWEGLSRSRQREWRIGTLEHSLVGRWGMISDDTEHSILVGEALLVAGHDVQEFQRDLARRMRWWLAALPAGVGFATLRAIIRLWVGINPSRSGVYSAGNGPAMRSAIIGSHVDDPVLRRELVRASAQITHSDPRAEVAASAVAELTSCMVRGIDDVVTMLAVLEGLDPGVEWQTLVGQMREGWEERRSVGDFAQLIGATNGVSGYAFQSVPVALYAAVVHLDDFRAAIEAVVACGGDTDTTAAITGAVLGARLGIGGIPESWRAGLVDWPRSLPFLSRLGAAIEERRVNGYPNKTVSYCWPAIPLRNVVFLAVVLLHGFRRLLPPY